MELVDIIIINKADGDLIPVARLAMAEFRTALNVIAPKSDDWKVQIKLCSAKDKKNIDDIWKTVLDYWRIKEETGSLQERRSEQRTDWMWKMIQEELMIKYVNNRKILGKFFYT